MTTATQIKTRFLDIEAKAVDEDSFSLSFSSENPLPTPMGDEILLHKREAVDLSRLNDGAPFLWNHQESLRLQTMTEPNYWLMKCEPVVSPLKI